MREPILKAVAMPPKMFWAPFVPAAANFAIQCPLMFISLGLWNTNPIVFIPFIVIGHLFLIVYGAREPHLSNMMRTYGPFASGSKNLYKSKGMKLAP